MDVREIKDLIKFLDKTDIKEFQYENGEESIYISKKDDIQQVINQVPSYAPMQAAPAPAAVVPAAESSVSSVAVPTVSGKEITSPIVGTFYEAPAPGASPFAREGDTIRKGQTLCIVEAMKIMNEIEAEYDCKIVKKLGQNGVPVEYGETIFIVEPL
jgi:acetyl-CoA carboxylase biotin carboxyl carrier protein